MNRLATISGIGVFCLIFMGGRALAQELSGLKQAEPFTVTGGVGVNTIGYATTDSIGRQDPFRYVMSGNLNLNFYGVVNCPFRFTYSNMQENYSHPFNFNQFGLQPSYKGVKAYLGYNSMHFSGYTLNGHQFLGVGVEVRPTELPVIFGAMYGRLREAISPDSAKGALVGSYARYGYAVKAGYEGDKSRINVVLFKSEDRFDTLMYHSNKSELLKPEENLVMSLAASTKVAQRLTLDAEWAASAFTHNLLEEKANTENILFANTEFLMPSRASTTVYTAGKMALNYTGKLFSIGSTYERVEPGYQTHGAYYFTNDFEHLTLNVSRRFLKDKINIAIRSGVERNNLDNTRTADTRKWVSNLNATVRAGEKTNLQVSYSNFTGYTYIRNALEEATATTPYDNLDTLDFTQVNESVNINVSHAIGDKEDKEKAQQLNLNISAQRSAGSEGKDDIPETIFFNGNLSYNISWLPKKLTVFTSVNGNLNQLPDMDNQAMIAPTVGVSKGLFENQLKLMGSLSYNTQIADKALSTAVLRSSLNYTLKEHHSFNLLIVALNKQSSFAELTITAGYKYRFKSSFNEIFR